MRGLIVSLHANMPNNSKFSSVRWDNNLPNWFSSLIWSLLISSRKWWNSLFIVKSGTGPRTLSWSCYLTATIDSVMGNKSSFLEGWIMKL